MSIAEGATIRPIRPAARLRLLGDEALNTFKAATLRILAGTGVHCPSDRALAIYAEHGAQVDFDSKIVKIPAHVVQEHMAHAPREYTLGARNLYRHGRVWGGDHRLRYSGEAAIRQG